MMEAAAILFTAIGIVMVLCGIIAITILTFVELEEHRRNK